MPAMAGRGAEAQLGSTTGGSTTTATDTTKPSTTKPHRNARRCMTDD